MCICFVMFRCLVVSGREEFPVDTPLVLRLDKDAYGKKRFFSWTEVSISIMQWNCTTIGSCSGKKRTNGSAAELHEPMATIPARSRQIPPKWVGNLAIKAVVSAIGSSDFFSFSDDDFVYTDPEAYSPLTRLAAGPSDLDLLGWSAFSTRPSIAAVLVPFAAAIRRFSRSF